MTSSAKAESMNASQRDAVLVAAARRGDIAAFEALLDGHLDRGYRIASVLLGASDADAAVVDASLAAWRHLPRLHDASQFGTWFESILVGACRMRARGSDKANGRASGRVWSAPDEDGSAPGGDPTASEHSHDGVIEFEEALARLDRAFDRLDPTDRTVLVLHEVAGQAAAEIAGTIHEPVGVVRVRLAESRAALLGALEAEA